MRKNYSKKYVLLLAFVMMSFMAFAQSGGIKGQVFDDTNQPLPGATVTIVGTTSGASTDVNGNYTITGLKPGTYNLTANFLGYITLKKTVTIENSVITVNFNLQSQNTSLNEVVVIGYGTQKVKDVTGSVAMVTSKDFDQGVITTPEQLIQGKVAGVNITSNSGAPGSGSTITIRGGASISGGNDPLIVLDGVPLAPDGISGAANGLDLINPNDIESFSILKDASAAAIYGNRASNGVILITTKKGKSGKPEIDFNTQVSMSQLPKEAPVMTADQFRDYINSHDTTKAGVYRQYLGTANTDWQKEIYQTSVNTDDNLSVSGAAGKVPYRVSVGFDNQDGIIKTTALQRYTGAINLSPSLLDDHLKINFNFKGSSQNQRFVNEGQVIGDAETFNPTVPVTSSNSLYAPYGGYWQWTNPTNTPTGLKALAPLNPVGLLNQTLNTSQVYRAITSLAIDYKLHFFPDLHVNINTSYDASKSFGSTKVPDNAASNLDSYQSNGTYYSGEYDPYTGNEQNKLFEGYLSYAHDFKNIKSHVDAVAGYSIQDFINTQSNGLFDVGGSYFQQTGSNQYTFNNGIVNLGSAANNNAYGYLINEYILTSFYGRVNYNYAGKYYLTASVRSDESTKFAPGTRTGVFPSAALAWRISDEDFLKGNPVLSLLKLRLEYGVTGNEEGIQDYDYLSQYSLSTTTAEYAFGNKSYQLYRPGAYYPGRTWETTASTNIGLDYGFLNDRLTGSIDYYYNKTRDLLVNIQQAAGTNFSNQIVGNVGNMQNQGLEFSVNGKIIENKDISWSGNFNIAFNRNKITNLTAQVNPNYPGLLVGGISGGTGNTIEINQPGYARNTFWVYQQVYGQNGKPLDGVFVDRNGDGAISNPQDLYHDGSPDPKEIMGLSSDFRYRKWTLGFVARVELGNYVYNNFNASTGNERAIMNSDINIISNGDRDALTNTLTGDNSIDLLSSYYVENGSFFRMDNMHLAYNVGSIFHGFGNLSASFNVQNAFIITDYKGIDPEYTYTGTGVGSASAGVDNNLYPRPRTFVLGLNLRLK